MTVDTTDNHVYLRCQLVCATRHQTTGRIVLHEAVREVEKVYIQNCDEDDSADVASRLVKILCV